MKLTTKSRYGMNAMYEDVYKRQQLFYRAQAALLAGTLEEVEPCPVCGSRTHPVPARPAGDCPDRQALAAFERQEAVSYTHLSQPYSMDCLQYIS